MPRQYLNDAEAMEVLGISNGELDEIVAHETTELKRRVIAYRGDRPPPNLEDRTVVVVDGVATGVTDTAALRALMRQRPRRLVLAVPVCPPDAVGRLRAEADDIVCLRVPERLFGVGHWYRDFSQVSDEEVISALEELRNVPA